MFRISFAALLYFLATFAGSAAGHLSGVSPATGHSGYHPTPSLITRDHIQMQLDWRSYYLNRMAVRRLDVVQDATGASRPAVDSTN